MRLWTLTFQEKCPVGSVGIEYFYNLLQSQGVTNVLQSSKTSLVFQSKDVQNWKFWSKLAKQELEPYFYYSILELKNSNCLPIGPMNAKISLEIPNQEFVVYS